MWVVCGVWWFCCGLFVLVSCGFGIIPKLLCCGFFEGLGVVVSFEFDYVLCPVVVLCFYCWV